MYIGSRCREAFVVECAGAGQAGPYVVVSDDRVAALHAEPLAGELERAGLTVRCLSFPEGEASKSRATKSVLEDRLSALGLGRDCTVVAVGGGVTTDLAGFLASTWHRGVSFVALPTTLLAMVDAAIGGKTGVNLPQTKNAVGTVHPPRAVWVDPDFLETLDDRQFRQGLAEVVKAGVIADDGFFSWLEASAAALGGRDPEIVTRMIVGSVRIKAQVVSRDAVERGERAILNFGHTVAHAVEAVTGFAEPHGRAVAVGMCAEARLAREVTGFPVEEVERLERLLVELGLPVRLPDECDPERLLAAATRDKKSVDGAIRCALPARIGAMADRESGCRFVDRAALAAALVEVRDDSPN